MKFARALRLPAFMPAFLSAPLSWVVLGSMALAISAGPSACLSPPDDAGAAAVPPRGCTPDGWAPPLVAPGGYYTSGGTVCTADGTPHVFHGVDRPSMEWASTGVGVSAADFQLIASWGANVVRIATNQDFWLSGAALYDPMYRATVIQAVAWAEQAGLDVILDLHWSDCGDLTVSSTDHQGCGNSNQQEMADVNSLEFWREVAAVFKDDGHVLFELYNEPHDISWDAWLNGTSTGAYTIVGMQQLYDAIRNAGANNVVIAGGLGWAYNLSDVQSGGHYVKGYNVMYATHPYLLSGDLQGTWESSFGHLETTDFAPVIATEFGDGRAQCTGTWDDLLIQFVDAHHASWTAWAWYPAGCSFPALISDWSGTPTDQGKVVRQHLSEYPAVARPPSIVDAGAPDVGADATSPSVTTGDGSIDAGTDATLTDASAAADDAEPTNSLDASADDGSADDVSAGDGSPADMADSSSDADLAADSPTDDASDGSDADSGLDE